ncbi:MAG: HAMP domain-containing histidine kinase [Bacteroidetes bacterium]|nr:HAMP domain-containing histidine kinase [Bacteroidota bacterium]
MRFFTSVYLILLAYTVSALVFWGFSLQKKSEERYLQERTILSLQVDSTANPEYYKSRLSTLKDRLDRDTKQYIGEGSTFLIVILIGAVVVYTSLRRRILLSRQQNNFMLSVTHELKSPIAAVKLNLQTLERYDLDEKKKAVLVERCINEANRLNDLCNNMLIASQMEGKQYVPAKEQLDFAALVLDNLKNYTVRHGDRVAYNESEFAHVTLNGDKLLLQMAINNLMENALKYSPADSKIEVSLVTKQHSVCFSVADNGPGIPDSEKGKVFNKFYRVGNEETRKTKGTGLGLYLTSKIVTQHNGKIHLHDNKPTGCVFEITLPIS